MLLRIEIRNFVFIEEAALDFGPGLNVVTGETGAGKSIFLGALSATLGERLSADLIQPGKNHAKVTSVFDVSRSPEVVAALAELGFDASEPILTLRREIDLEGKSKAFLNDQPARQTLLRELAGRLIDLHGQHDNQVLFQAARHAAYFDLFAGLDRAEAGAWKAAWKELSAAQAEKTEAARAEEELRKEKDFLEYTVRELKDKLISPAEYDRLREEVKRRAAMEKGTRVAAQADDALGAVSQGFGKLEAQLIELSKVDESAESNVIALREAVSRLDEIREDLASRLEGAGGEGPDIDEMQARLSRTEALKKKYGLQVEALFAKLEEAETKLAALGSSEGRRIDAERNFRKAAATAEKAAKALREARKKAMPAFESAMRAEMEFLGMKGARITLGQEPVVDGIAVSADCQVVESGADRCEFLYAPVRETAPKRLRETASGGEISRIMLAFKKVLEASIPAHTLVFDEIDTGIGGSTALNVGRKMREIAGDRQLLVITHLPQIAKFADTHFRVVRGTGDAGRTTTRILTLDAEARVAEVARMLSGEQGEADLAFARRYVAGETEGG